MSTGLSGFFAAHVGDFRSGRIDRMLPRYALPLVLELREGTRLLPRLEDIAAALHRARGEISVTTLAGARLGQCQTLEGRNGAKVHVRYDSIAGVPSLPITYYVSRRHGRVRIEMIEMKTRSVVERWYRAFSIRPGDTWRTRNAGEAH